MRRWQMALISITFYPKVIPSQPSLCWFSWLSFFRPLLAFPIFCHPILALSQPIVCRSRFQIDKKRERSLPSRGMFVKRRFMKHALPMVCPSID
ncbi:hypothetical protein QBC45DRAFT_215856 [Copromyces sp. CBS 386.78]|nr:hypothetical protein QBC45DRAFT_215856 [Copromyces sp. CBS 386.78]